MDESLVLFKGRLQFCQYLPRKRAQFGLKIYKLFESGSGYTYTFRVYEGKDTQFALLNALLNAPLPSMWQVK